MNWNGPPKIVDGKYRFSVKDNLAIFWHDYVVLYALGIPLAIYMLIVVGIPLLLDKLKMNNKTTY